MRLHELALAVGKSSVGEFGKLLGIGTHGSPEFCGHQASLFVFRSFWASWDFFVFCTSCISCVPGLRENRRTGSEIFPSPPLPDSSKPPLRSRSATCDAENP